MRRSANLDLLLRVAEKIAPLLDDVVLVGGCAVDLLVTDPAAPPPRVTIDVDLTAEVSSYLEYSDLSSRLATLGFKPGRTADDPICRFRDGNGLTIDLMPSAPEVLGFGSRWYRQAITEAWKCELTSAVAIRCITAPLLLATKLEAFHARGRQDHMASRDLEDVVTLVNGRRELAVEFESASPALTTYVVKEVKRLTASEGFRNALPGLIASQESGRLSILWSRLRAIAGMSQ